MIEIVTLNLVLTLAMQALPLEVLGDGDPANAYSAHRDDMLRLLAHHYVGAVFAAVASFVFALLLLSAVNTAVTDLVSIQYMMARDGELPRPFSGLNRFGMPALGLVSAAAVPLVVVALVPDVADLADLYAIGVIGAVAVNLGTCSSNWSLEMRWWERLLMSALALLMMFIWGTIAWEKPWALLFALSIMAVGLAGRWLAHNRQRIGQWMLEPVRSYFPPAAEPDQEPAYTDVPQPFEVTAQPQLRILAATRGNPRLVEFALEEAKSRQAELLLLFVRHVAFLTMGSANRPDAAADAEAQALFQEAQKKAVEAGVPVRLLYAVADDVAEAILDLAATHSADLLILGATQRGALWRTMKGDVLQEVGKHLPERTQLLVYA